MAASKVEGDASGVLEIWHGIDEPGARVGTQYGFKVVHVHPVPVHAHGGVRGLEDVEGDNGAKESWVFDDNGVAGFEHHLCGKIKTLLRSLKYEDIVDCARGAVVAHALGDLGAQLRNAIRYGVLQSSGGMLGEQTLVDGLEFV